MKLLLRRDQKPGMLGMGKITFLLDVRAQLTEDEQANVKKYKMGDTLLYSQKEIQDKSQTIGGSLSMIAKSMMNLTISVKDLAEGKRVECKDILEMLAAEEQIKQACQTFAQVLRAAATFGGEEIVEIQ